MEMGTALPGPRVTPAALPGICTPPWPLTVPWKPCPWEGEGQFLGTRLLGLLASCTAASDQWLAQPSHSPKACSSSFIHSKYFQSTRSRRGSEEPARQEEVGWGWG